MVQKYRDSLGSKDTESLNIFVSRNPEDNTISWDTWSLRVTLQLFKDLETREEFDLHQMILEISSKRSSETVKFLGLKGSSNPRYEFFDN